MSAAPGESIAFKTSTDVFFLLIGAVMVTAMHAGFAFLEVGTVRKKNQVNALIKIFKWDFQAPGATTTVVLLLFFSGIQLFFLGVLGEYIGAIHSQVRPKPFVAIREKINFASDSAAEPPPPAGETREGARP